MQPFVLFVYLQTLQIYTYYHFCGRKIKWQASATSFSLSMYTIHTGTVMGRYGRVCSGNCCRRYDRIYLRCSNMLKPPSTASTQPRPRSSTKMRLGLDVEWEKQPTSRWRGVASSTEIADATTYQLPTTLFWVNMSLLAYPAREVLFNIIVPPPLMW